MVAVTLYQHMHHGLMVHECWVQDAPHTLRWLNARLMHTNRCTALLHQRVGIIKCLHTKRGGHGHIVINTSIMASWCTSVEFKMHIMLCVWWVDGRPKFSKYGSRLSYTSPRPFIRGMAPTHLGGITRHTFEIS